MIKWAKCGQLQKYDKILKREFKTAQDKMIQIRNAQILSISRSVLLIQLLEYAIPPLSACDQKSDIQTSSKIYIQFIFHI